MKNPMAAAATERQDRDWRLTPHFRALPIGTSRKAFRLEAIFWQALEAIAARNGRTLTEEIGVTLARAEEGANGAATLRASVASDLFDLWSLAASRHARLDWTQVLDEIPGQAFAMTPSQTLLRLNPPLKAQLRAFGLGECDGEPPKDVGVAVDPAVIAQIERKAAFIDCSVNFYAPGQRRTRRARLGPASTGPGSHAVLIGFVND